MRKTGMASLSFLVFFGLLVASTAHAETRSVNVADRAINSAPLLGPEGIVLGADGTAYISERDGKIRRVLSDGSVEEFADLNTYPGERKKPIGAIGLAMDKEGDIYAATLTALDGAVLKIAGPGKPDAGKVTMYRYGINSANFILVDDESGTMYVSDSSMLSGGVFRFDMNDDSLTGSVANPKKESLGKYSYANGLELSPDKKWLYVAETTKGRVSRINLDTGESEVFADIGGWADGLLIDAERELLFVADNKGGRIVAVDFSGKIVGDAHLMGKEDQCAPACLVFSDPDTIVFTDLWKASLLRALIGRPQSHSYVYKISVDEIVQ